MEYFLLQLLVLLQNVLSCGILAELLLVDDACSGEKLLREVNDGRLGRLGASKACLASRVMNRVLRTDTHLI